jgi:hypothetical protein
MSVRILLCNNLLTRWKFCLVLLERVQRKQTDSRAKDQRLTVCSRCNRLAYGLPAGYVAGP